jgi:hypothetical protein
MKNDKARTAATVLIVFRVKFLIQKNAGNLFPRLRRRPPKRRGTRWSFITTLCVSDNAMVPEIFGKKAKLAV